MIFAKSIISSEEEIIKGCCDGSEKCFKQLFEKHYGKMLNVCIRYASSKDEAKDLVQDGFIRAFKNIAQFNFKGSFEGWLRRVMVTNAINHIHKNHFISITDHLPENGSERMQEIENGRFEETILSELAAKDILQLVQALPPGYKMVFNLSVIEGLSHKEIAELLNITESTSRSNLLKARLKLQEMIKISPLNKIIKSHG